MSDYDNIRQIINGKIISVTPVLGKGEVNRVYIIERDADNLIVWLNDKSELTRYKKEVWCIKKSISADIPSPQVIDVGVKNDSAYMLLDFVEGKTVRISQKIKKKYGIPLVHMQKR